MATHYQRVWVCVSRPILNNAKTIILNTNPETSWIMRWLVYLLQSQTHLYHCMQPVRRSFKRQRGSKLLTNCSTTECTIKPVGSFQFPTDDLPCGLRDLAMTWSIRCKYKTGLINTYSVSAGPVAFNATLDHVLSLTSTRRKQQQLQQQQLKK